MYSMRFLQSLQTGLFLSIFSLLQLPQGFSFIVFPFHPNGLGLTDVVRFRPADRFVCKGRMLDEN
jgi:hypothetical protein